MSTKTIKLIRDGEKLEVGGEGDFALKCAVGFIFSHSSGAM